MKIIGAGYLCYQRARQLFKTSPMLAVGIIVRAIAIAIAMAVVA